MTPVKLAEDLKEELEEVLEHFRFPTPKGEECKLNIFTQALPILDSEEDEEPYPYIIIRTAEGKIPDSTSAQKVSAGILIGIYDMDTKNEGDKHVLNIINDICERFQKNPVLRDQYYAEDEMEWVLQYENTYPYYFGGVELTFNIPTFRRESEYA